MTEAQNSGSFEIAFVEKAVLEEENDEKDGLGEDKALTCVGPIHAFCMGL